MPKSNLLYIYAEKSVYLEPVFGKLIPSNLLIPPVWTNRLAWTRGYFRVFKNAPLSQKDLLSQHCFKESFTKKFFDEEGRTLNQPSVPIGSWGLSSYAHIDNLVSDALGIPRVIQSKD